MKKNVILLTFAIGIANLTNAQRWFGPSDIKEQNQFLNINYRIDSIFSIAFLTNSASGEQGLFNIAKYSIEWENNYIKTLKRYDHSLYEANGTISGNIYEVIIKDRTPFEDELTIKAKEVWYNDGTNDTMIVFNRFDTSTNSFYPYQRERYYYNNDNKLNRRIYTYSNDKGITWLNSTDFYFIYNSNNLLDSVKGYLFDQTSQSYGLYYYEKYYYTGSSIDSTIVFRGSATTGIYEARFKNIIHKKNTDGSVQEYITYSRPSGGSVFSPNSGYSFNKQTRFYVFVNEAVKDNLINIYPNPATDKINIQTDLALRNTTYKIFSISGSCINSGLVNFDRSVDIGILNNGIYFLHIEDAETGKTYIKKFIKN
ncbi:MAG: T9SS type A sorting domain-containing protein [Bacteroidia bacterium]